jgi:Family of unknown function (DUF6788)
MDEASAMENEKAESLPKELNGAVVAQMVRCGKPSCKCARGELHGPYFYRFWRTGRRLRKTYVRKSEAAAIKAACDNYRNEQREIRQMILENKQQWRDLKALLKELGL